MATYAAYRHVELDKVGCGKRSIMKPPGGDCHDIFGADFHGTPSHHRVLKPPGGGTSSLFATTPEEDPKPRVPQTTTDGPASQNTSANQNGVDNLYTKIGNDSQINEEKLSKYSVYKGNAQDSISTHSSNLSAEIKNLPLQEEKRQRASLISRNCVTGEGCQTTDHYVIRVHKQKDGNPVTGEGYSTPDTQTAAPSRNRVPPGGYSSGLW